MKKIIPIVPHKEQTLSTPRVDTRNVELIVKITEKCNFKCTFCSSTNLSDDDGKLLDLDKIFRFLEKYPNTNTIIVNGGDPLMVPIQYYWDLIEYLDKHELKTTISLTTNLWAFKIKPEKWTPLFKHPRIGVTTSFNYGDTRRVTEDVVYTEDMFWQISDLMLEHVGYRPDFISVITDENEDTALKNVELAKRMGVECKLNHAMASGEQGKPYQFSKIYQLYLQVYKQGLTEWEHNTKLLLSRLSKGTSMCPQLRSCDEHIRCLQPDGDYYSCGSFADDKKYAIDFEQEMAGETFTPLQSSFELFSLKEECPTCPMFEICNGCKKTISDMKAANIVEDHCRLMKTLAPGIMELNNIHRNDTLAI